MRILICPDKFKGTLTAAEATDAIAEAVRRQWPTATVIRQPLADGGEGSLALIARQFSATRHRLKVTGPLARPVDAEFLLTHEGHAWIESSQACGLRHVPKRRRNPAKTTTIGVGELIEEAIVRGAKEITLFLGGSATNDCGAGMAGALGYRFFSNRPEDFIPSGDSLRWVQRIDTEEVLSGLDNIRFTMVCDVDNPLLGPDGATFTYAPQKGARPEQLPVLEENMRCFVDCLERWRGRAYDQLPGGGAAGGLAVGGVAFLNATLKPGTEVLLDAVKFNDLLQGVDLVITGEGHLDQQTLAGKLIAGVGRRAKAANTPKVIALCGRKSLADSDLATLGVHAAYSLVDHPEIGLEAAMNEPGRSLERLAAVVLERDF